MIKVTIENTETKEVQEFEGMGIVFTIPQQDGYSIEQRIGIEGNFSNFILKMSRKVINKTIKMALKEEGRVE